MVTRVEVVMYRTEQGEEYKTAHDANKSEARAALAAVLYAAGPLSQNDCDELAANILEDEAKRNAARKATIQYTDAIIIQREYAAKGGQ